MARKVANFDELNIFDYFSEMDLPQEEIDKRIVLAQMIKDSYRRLFVKERARKAIRSDADLDYQVFEDYLVEEYFDILKKNGIEVDTYTKEYVEFVAKEVTDTTQKHWGEEHTLSDARAVEIAVNDANVVLNHERDEQAKASGKKYKVWHTEMDDKVRETHSESEGQRVPIDKPFTVGFSQLMYPCDTSLGADPSEIIGCRCVAEYQ